MIRYITGSSLKHTSTLTKSSTSLSSTTSPCKYYYSLNQPVSTSCYFYSTASSFSSKSLRIALVGAPGSGKGTQSAKMERDFGLKPISTGQILRQVASDVSPLGKEIKAILDSGKLVSDEFMLKVMQEYLGKMKEQGYLLDGYPRTTKQAEDLDKWLEERKMPLDFVLYLDVPEEVLMDRIQDRWIHPSSGRVYNSQYNPPKVKGVDDVTGEALVKRSDDNDLKVRERIDTYHRETLPILTHYKTKGKLLTVHSPNSDVGYESIKTIFEKYK
ncbi:adenylate kinase [Cavenderia fasciculata]|uniref:Adenylate kinase n=1 Tax=Cavenderia fasciculata TaxID=261658 RepID=F4QD50_CACFS|nr:adenylate kinase [Cavenderia fasciculata]EGG14521.1 adenylate kinase [Cavenderia fasciculata]|eukprot:XP_004353945.1 adenylate kinase [Cavenderia fasciculata]